MAVAAVGVADFAHVEILPKTLEQGKKWPFQMQSLGTDFLVRPTKLGRVAKSERP